MLRSVNTEVLIKNNITAHQFIILALIFQKKYTLLDEYLKSSNTYDDFLDDLLHLKSKSLVYYNPEIPPHNYKSIMVSEDGFRTLGNYNNFEELLNTYPIKVRRPDGKETFLRRDRKNTEQIYSIIVKGDRSIHDHIMKCLKFELQDRESTGNLKYIKTLYNWLADKEWRNYEDVVDDESYTKKKEIYGDKIE